MDRDVIVASLAGGARLDLGQAQLAAPQVTLATVSPPGGTKVTVPPGDTRRGVRVQPDRRYQDRCRPGTRSPRAGHPDPRSHSSAEPRSAAAGHPGGYRDRPSSRGLPRDRLTRPDARAAAPARLMISPPQRIDYALLVDGEFGAAERRRTAGSGAVRCTVLTGGLICRVRPNKHPVPRPRPAMAVGLPPSTQGTATAQQRRVLLQHAFPRGATCYDMRELIYQGTADVTSIRPGSVRGPP
jgi:hypothetical protein